MLAIYGRRKTDSRFKPFDSTNGALVNNRVYMTLYSVEQREELEDYVTYMNENNKDYEFEIREV